MLPKTASDIPPSEITPQSVYLSRRKFLACGSAAAAGLAIGPTLLELLSPLQKVQAGTKLNAPIKSPFSTNENQTSYNDVTHYNNFYSRHHSGAQSATSTAEWIRRLGGKRWQRLHRLVYASAIAGVVHYYWLVKSDIRKPVFYGMMLALLLLYRIGAWLVRRPAPLRASASGTRQLTLAEEP